jgi:hypothetical protein
LRFPSIVSDPSLRWFTRCNPPAHKVLTQTIGLMDLHDACSESPDSALRAVYQFRPLADIDASRSERQQRAQSAHEADATVAFIQRPLKNECLVADTTDFDVFVCSNFAYA